MADHDKVGQGSSEFRAFLRGLPDDIAKAREDGLPVVLERTTPLAPHAQRLMDALGVEVRIVTAATPTPVNDRLRVGEGAHGDIVILAAHCGRCQQESMPTDEGLCSWCRTKIVDEDQLAVAGAVLDVVGSRLSQLDLDGRRTVWVFVAPLVEKALADG